MLLVLLAPVLFAVPAEGKWTKLADGLLLGEFPPTRKSPVTDEPIVVLKVDPSRYSLRLLSALEHGDRSRTTREWCEEFGLVAAVNAGMYRSNLRSTGYMKNYKHANNPSINPVFGAFMLFNPKDRGLPPVKWIDSRRDKRWKEWLERYDSVVQNYRMVSSGQRVKWPAQDKAHSTAALGMDGAGHVLFILSRGIYTPHDFIDVLLSLPIHLRDAMYLEGGDEASLTLHHEGKWRTWAGMSGLPFLPNSHGPRIPNAIGIAGRG